ncbi:MAG: hypothetical protein M3505_07105, partial [Verrucomicrobiota bacterium]|nr:hypothetical protein [Verrucomicrobiota bacterium]
MASRSWISTAAIDDALVEVKKVDGSLGGSRIGVKDCAQILSENFARRAAPSLLVQPGTAHDSTGHLASAAGGRLACRFLVQRGQIH